jgi:hypothetical protein
VRKGWIDGRRWIFLTPLKRKKARIFWRKSGLCVRQRMDWNGRVGAVLSVGFKTSFPRRRESMLS